MTQYEVTSKQRDGWQKGVLGRSWRMCVLGCQKDRGIVGLATTPGGTDG